MMKQFCLLSIFLFLGTTIAISQSQSGLQFLNIGPNATSLGSSEAHTAVNLGASSIFTNPAMLRASEENELKVSYGAWIADTKNSHAAALFHRENDSFGFGILTSIVDDIEARDSPGAASGLFNVRYLSLAGSYARSIGPISLGATAMYINEQLFEQNASGYGLNFGISTHLFDDRITIGSALLNLGEMDELAELASELPTSFKFGVQADVIQFSVSESSEIPLLIGISTDMIVPLHNSSTTQDSENIAQSDVYFASSLSVEISELITIRGGFRTGNTTRPYSFGAGVKSGVFDFNYAFVPFETGFGSTHTISLGYNF